MGIDMDKCGDCGERLDRVMVDKKTGLLVNWRYCHRCDRMFYINFEEEI